MWCSDGDKFCIGFAMAKGGMHACGTTIVTVKEGPAQLYNLLYVHHCMNT